MAEGMVDGMMANHSLDVSIVDKLIIVLSIVGKSLAKLIGLSILPLLMLILFYPQVWWSYLGRTVIILWSFKRHLQLL